MKKKKILIQRADKLGDLVLSLPVIENLKDNYPGLEIHVLTSNVGAEFLQNNPLVDKVYIVRWSKKWFNEYTSLIRRLKKEKYDIYLSLWNNPWMAWLGFFLRINVRIGDATNPTLRWLYNLPVLQKWRDYCKHQAEFNLDLLGPFQINKIKVKAKVFTSDKVDQSVKKYADKYLDPRNKNIVIFFGTGGTNYPIPETAVLEFIDLVTQNNKFNVLLCGQIEGNNGISNFEKRNVRNLLNKTTLEELVSFIKFADYYIGPDTGPTHIAAFLNKPMVFFSPIKPNPPTRWGPYSDYFKIIRKDYKCEHIKAGKCIPKKCFSYFTGKYLFNVFSDLVHAVSLCDNFDEVERKKYLLSKSLRIMYVTRNKQEYFYANEHTKKLRDAGLHIFIYRLERGVGVGSFFRMIKKMRQWNINIIQGDLPKWFVFLLKFYMGEVKQYIKPIYINYPIHSYIDMNDLLQMYKEEWAKA
jgi:heptosyltransferase I